MPVHLVITYTNDYGDHKTACDDGGNVSANFYNPTELIAYIQTAIYQAYHAGEEIYDEANICIHGYSVQYIIIQIVKVSADDDADEDDDPLVLTFDVYNHEKSYDEMLLELDQVHEVGSRVDELFL